MITHRRRGSVSRFVPLRLLQCARALSLLLAAGGGCAVGGFPPPVGLPAPGVIIIAEGLPRGPSSYGGSELCRTCHDRIFAFWKGTAHAGSMSSLDSTSDRGNPSCLRCHATGYGESTGYGDGREKDGLDAVGCESCHGPAGEHATSRDPSAVTAGGGSDCPPCEVQRLCRTCHTPSRAPDFELGKDLRKVSCRRLPGEAGSERGKEPAAE